MCNGIFGSLFDFNNDGKLDAFEQASEFAFLAHMCEEDGRDVDDDESDYEN